MSLDTRIRTYTDDAAQEFVDSDIPPVAEIRRRRRRGDGLRIIAGLAVVVLVAGAVLTIARDREPSRSGISTQPPAMARPTRIIGIDPKGRPVELSADGKTATVLGDPEPNSGRVNRVRFLPDGRVAYYAHADDWTYGEWHILGTDIERRTGYDADLAADGHSLVSPVELREGFANSPKVTPTTPTLQIQDLRDPNVHREIATGAYVSQVVWSRDGKRIYAVQRANLVTVDVASGRVVHTIPFQRPQDAIDTEVIGVPIFMDARDRVVTETGRGIEAIEPLTGASDVIEPTAPSNGIQSVSQGPTAPFTVDNSGTWMIWVKTRYGVSSNFQPSVTTAGIFWRNMLTGEQGSMTGGAPVGYVAW